MVEDEIIKIFVCPRDLIAGDAPGACPLCGTERVECSPGEPDDTSRRPLIDTSGRVQTRAPLWWLRHTVTRLTEHLESD